MRRRVGKAGDWSFRYQGQYEDQETGLYYNRFRYYDPQQGSYISQDPIGLAGANPTLYAYVSDPSTWFDPFGLAPNRCTPRLETGNVKEGWIHIEGRHITGTIPGKPGHITTFFAPGTTRQQLEQAANKIVKKGKRVTEDVNLRMQTFEKKVTINGRRQNVSITVDSHDVNRIITMFPKL